MMTSKQPHIIFIITDQQRYDTIAGLGYPFMETPTLTGLSRRVRTLHNAMLLGPHAFLLGQVFLQATMRTLQVS